MITDDESDLDEFSPPLVSNSPLSSSWDLTARLLRLRKKLRASSSFMKIFFTGPAARAGGSTQRTKQERQIQRFSPVTRPSVRPDTAAEWASGNTVGEKQKGR